MKIKKTRLKEQGSIYTNSLSLVYVVGGVKLSTMGGMKSRIDQRLNFK